ncbi:unnamed protein product [Paramecium sonneborni]|uniref:Uncharacterized protein n=1 Tax=Paramecium sonneborni TaxID=65129 RepID=A0A8S1NB83_9CILI|nr:unnamed protein product [Paramecium sonneborni]
MTRLNYSNQNQMNNIQINEEDYSISKFFTDGIWSKYNPLSKIKQNGLYGLLDSNCYQLHNAIDFEQQTLNLIYYDFLDYEYLQLRQFNLLAMIIDNIYLRQILENMNMRIFAWPQLNILDLIIAKYQDIVLRKQIQIKYPFMDSNLILTFGRQLQNNKFKNYRDLLRNSFQNINVQICEKGEDNIKIQDQNINYLVKYAYISEQINCDIFILILQFKIIEIVSMDQEYKFQIIKLGPNLDSEVYQNDNLAAFQLYYLISENTFKIFITIYNYMLPGININFENNPFLIQKEYLICSKPYQQLALLICQIKIQLIIYFNNILLK